MLPEPAHSTQPGMSPEDHPSIPTKSSPSLPTELLGYAIAVTITMLLVLSLFRISSFEQLHTPFVYASDGLYYLTIVKTMDETGWYYYNDRIGQLGGQDYRAFPTSDGWLHYLIVIAILKLGFDPFTTSNLFYLLTYPLVTIMTLFVCRRLGMSYVVSLMISLLYTFQPYHVGRLPHPYLAAYYLVPLAVLLIIRLYQGRLPFRVAEQDRKSRWKFLSVGSLGALLIAALIGTGGVYYAFFTCFFFMIAGTARSYTERRWAPIVSAGILSCIVFMTLAVTLWPSMEYKLNHPKNGDAPKRFNFESEMYGLKVIQLLMPVSGHRWKPLKELNARYYAPGLPIVNQSDVSSLGIIGSIGLVVLIIRLFLRGVVNSGAVLDGLALMTAGGILLATVGGFSAAISWFISPWIRAYDRISIFLALFALLAIGLLIDHYGRRWAITRWRQVLFVSGVIGLTVLGYFDETNRIWVPRYGDIEYQMGIDSRFVAKVEAVAPQEGLVFQLPHAGGGYPEGLFSNGVPTYEMLRPYLHSQHLRWSYGSIAGQFGDEWGKIITRGSTRDLVERLAQAEVVGISVDRICYQDGAAQIMADLKDVLVIEPIVSENDRLLYYDLGPYTAQAKSQFTASEWVLRRDRAQHPIIPLCRNGFFRDGTITQDGSARVCQKSGEIHLNNDLDVTRSVRLRFYVSLLGQVPTAAMHIHAPGWVESFELTSPQLIERQMSLPIGLTVMRFECDAKPLYSPGDPRRGMVFNVSQLECTEEMPGTSIDSDATK